MIKMAVVSVRLDDETKNQLDDFCETIGLSTSSVLKMVAKKITREQRIPFEIDVDPFYSPSNMKELKRRIEDMEAGRNIVTHNIIEI
jgi:DNA-damage-inducible protein J